MGPTTLTTPTTPPTSSAPLGGTCWTTAVRRSTYRRTRHQNTKLHKKLGGTHHPSPHRTRRYDCRCTKCKVLGPKRSTWPRKSTWLTWSTWTNRQPTATPPGDEEWSRLVSEVLVSEAEDWTCRLKEALDF